MHERSPAKGKRVKPGKQGEKMQSSVRLYLTNPKK